MEITVPDKGQLMARVRCATVVGQNEGNVVGRGYTSRHEDVPVCFKHATILAVQHDVEVWIDLVEGAYASWARCAYCDENVMFSGVSIHYWRILDHRELIKVEVPESKFREYWGLVDA